MNLSNLNQQLHDLYIYNLPALHKLIQQHAIADQLDKMSGPFMMHVHPEYETASTKLMIVGMETHTWEKYNLNEAYEDTYTRLTNRYQEFTTNFQQPNSPFWWLIRDLSASFHVTEYTKSVLWTNLSKIDISGSRPIGEVFDHTMQFFLELLIQEVAIVKPDILLMMTTDPNYQWHLKEKFGKAGYETIIPKLLTRWKTDRLPANTFQICHPNRLRFKAGGYKQNVELIIQSIKQYR